MFIICALVGACLHFLSVPCHRFSVGGGVISSKGDSGALKGMTSKDTDKSKSKEQRATTVGCGGRPTSLTGLGLEHKYSQAAECQ